MFIFDTNIMNCCETSKHFLKFFLLIIYLKGFDETIYFIITISITDALGEGMGDKVGSQRCSYIFVRYTTPPKLVFCKI